MKQIIFSFILIASGITNAATENIISCGAVGTRSEGWSIPGVGYQYDNCENQFAQCCAIGTRSEGWYKFEKNPVGLLAYANCKDSKEVPQCSGVGTRSEGWVLPDEKIQYDNC